MTVKVTGSGASSVPGFNTDAAGKATFTVTPSGADEVVVQICDSDGCLYGNNTIRPPAAPAGSGAAPPPPVAATSSSAAAVAIGPVTPTSGKSKGKGLWFVLIGGGILLAGTGAVVGLKKHGPAPSDAFDDFKDAAAKWSATGGAATTVVDDHDLQLDWAGLLDREQEQQDALLDDSPSSSPPWAWE